MSEKSPKREFFLNTDVSATSLKDIILGIHEVNNWDDEQEKTFKDFKRKPIRLTIDSFGGCCYSGMALVNTIDASKTDVHGLIFGKAMSMALTIFASCHKRFAHKRATLMQHQLSGKSEGKLMDMIQSDAQKEKLQDMMDEVLVENSKINMNTLLKYRERKEDWYFTGAEGLCLGVVDELIESKRSIK